MVTTLIDQISEDIVETIREPLLVLDSDLKVILANQSFYDSFKVKPEETVGQLIYDLGNKQWDIPKLRELLETILPQKTTFNDYEVEHYFPTIGKRIMHLNARQIIRETGKERIILLAIEDVTERIQLKSMLEDSEERFRRLFETANDGMLLLEKCEFKIRNANPAITSMLGYSNEDCIGNEMKDIGFPNDIGIFQEVMQTLDKDGIIYYKDIPSRKKDGQVVDTDIYMVDKASLIQCNIRDVTERKRSEEALESERTLLRNLIDNVPDRIYAKDSEGRFIICNVALARRMGMDSPTEIVGKSDFDFLPREIAQRFRTDEQTIIQSGTPMINREEPLTTEGGTITRWNLATKVPLLDKQGNRIGIVGVGREITDLKRAEAEKAKLEAQLQQAQKMESIGSLAGGIAHDLNNILFPISGLSEMLLDDMPPDNPAFEKIKQIYKSAQRGSDLVKQILSLSRQSNPQKLPIRIQPILKEALKLAQATIPRNIEVKSHINADCGLVSADPTQIHQIAMNLITNAFHAVEQTGGMIDIALKETAIGSFGKKDDLPYHAIPGDLLAGRYACITVSDTGTGIDQALIDRIFEPYFTTKELGKGTGLGLSVVHGIIKEHGGDIGIYSEVGKGTAFHVYLPLLEDAMDSKAATITRKYPTGHERILLVDDEEPIVLLEQMILERLGYQVTTRMSSPDALAAFKVNPDNFDLVISDRGMPNMTGDQLARELISIRPGIPIILCTGFSNENDVKRSKAMGVKGFLMKPVAIGDLSEMVRKVLDESKGSSHA